jgi:hypothetical protein
VREDGGEEPSAGVEDGGQPARDARLALEDEAERDHVVDLLTEVIFSNGRARRSMYVGDLLTEVRDEKGPALIHNWYRDGRVVIQDYANDERYRMHYGRARSGPYANEPTVVTSCDPTSPSGRSAPRSPSRSSSRT